MVVSAQTYRKHAGRMQARGNWFCFRRDFVIHDVMTKYEALFYQDLLNLSELEKTIKDGDGFFLCTVPYLERSLKWDHKTQAAILNSLTNKGFVEQKQHTRCRWVRLDQLAVETALDEALGKETEQKGHDSSLNGDDKNKNEKKDEKPYRARLNAARMGSNRQVPHTTNGTSRNGKNHHPPANGILPEPKTRRLKTSENKNYQSYHRQWAERWLVLVESRLGRKLTKWNPHQWATVFAGLEENEITSLNDISPRDRIEAYLAGLEARPKWRRIPENPKAIPTFLPIAEQKWWDETNKKYVEEDICW